MGIRLDSNSSASLPIDSNELAALNHLPVIWATIRVAPTNILKITLAKLAEHLIFYSTKKCR
jgi:hypothetical protein